MLRLVVAAIAAVLLLPTGGSLAADPPWVARSRQGMVASDSPEASRIGADVLASGGNAFDAAIATSLALAVARPQSTGLGGGGFMVAWLANEKQPVALDFRETAPAGATAERYAKLSAAAGDGPSPSVYGGNAVGVPGQLAGLAEIRRRYATRPLSELIQPAIDLARGGFVVDECYHDACAATVAKYKQWPAFGRQHGRLYETLLGNGVPPAVGTRVRRPALARTLELIARQGADAFYQGPIGAAAARAAQSAGGVLTVEDLAGYRVVERQPIRAPYREHEIISMPPPSSGGVCIIETLNILDALAGKAGRSLSALRSERAYAPALVFALSRGFADRAEWLGDPDFAEIPTSRLISPNYARGLAEEYGRSASPVGRQQRDDAGTSHFCVVDRAGNVVALTETINGTFGSLVVAEPFGIILNNEMDDFAANPGQPNLFGLIQGAANCVAPGKRPLSSMSPTIVMKANRPVLVLGGSGGPRIITAVLQVLLNVVEFGQPLDEALSAVRLHHQWKPAVVYFDQEPPPNLAASLAAAGYEVSERRKAGIVQVIRLLADGTMVGASDPRKGGRPAGVGE